MAEEHIGIVTHFFGKAHVAAIEITAGQLSVGDTIHVVGHTSDFTQQVDSMQVEHDQVQTANVGDQIGVRVIDHAREHDKVYRVLPD